MSRGPGSRGRTIRARVAVGLLVADALLSTGQLADYAVRTYVVGLGRPALERDEVRRAEARFAPLRPLLPPRGVVGYLSDRPEAVETHYLAQYALAPLVLRPGADAEVVIGNFVEPGEGARLARAAGLEVVRELGPGLVLLRRGAGR